MLENWLKKVSFVPTTAITFLHREWEDGGGGGGGWEVSQSHRVQKSLTDII